MQASKYIDLIRDTYLDSLFIGILNQKLIFLFVLQSGGCGNYGTAGSGIEYDFLHIPMPFAGGTGSLMFQTSNFCGGALISLTTAATAITGTGATAMALNQVTLCSKYLYSLFGSYKT